MYNIKIINQTHILKFDFKWVQKSYKGIQNRKIV